MSLGKTAPLCVGLLWLASIAVAQDTTSPADAQFASTMQTVNVLNHIIFMVQENRGLDHYFGALRELGGEQNFQLLRRITAV